MTKSNNTLPRGWQIKTLAQIGSFSKGKGITKAEIVEEGKPCIRYGQIYSEYHYFVEEFKSFINDTSANNSERIYKNDLLFAGSGETLEDIGKCVAYIKDEEAYAGGDIIILRTKSEDAHYLGYLFNSDEFRRQTFKLGQGHSVVHIYSSSLKNVKVALPPLPEQQKIAKILATWDKAIKTTKLSIHFLNEKNKGLIKTLFFDNENVWKKVEIKSIGKIVTGNTPPTNNRENYGNDFLFVSPVDMGTTKYIEKTANNLSLKGHSISRKVPVNTILYTCIGSTIGKIGIATKTLSTNQQINSIICNEDFDYEFVYYLLIANKKRILEYATNQAVPMINKSVFEEIIVKIPELSVQKNIAKILIKADEELKYYNLLLMEYQKQKQGLMQHLLSGKIRVKN